MIEASSSKKIGKARYALTKSKSSVVVKIIFLLTFLFFPVGLIIQMFEDNYYDTALVGFGMLTAFYSYFVLAITTVIPRFLGARQSALVKGNMNMYDLFIQFPLTKKQVLIKAFRNWTLISILPIATVIAMCVIPMFYERAQEVNSQVGLVVILTVLGLAALETVTILTVNTKMHKSTPFKIGYFIVLYALFMFAMLCGDKQWFINSISGFDIFSGFVGIIILLSIIPIMWILTKVFVLDKKGKEAWHYERND